MFIAEGYSVAGSYIALRFDATQDNSITGRIARATKLVDDICDPANFRPDASATKQAVEVARTNDAILILGAGATGHSAAIAAERKGLTPTIIDYKAIPFYLQANTETRWIHPYQYDWPAAHWENDRFPTCPPHYPFRANPTDKKQFHYPLSFRAERAQNIAEEWMNEVKKFGLHVRKNYHQEPEPFETGEDLVHFYDAIRARLDIDFKLVLCTYSIYDEDTTLSFGDEEYVGLRFWENDPFEEPQLGLPSRSEKKVVISGAGDGGLQDFVRIATGQKSAQDILTSLENAFDPETGRVFKTLVRDLSNYLKADGCDPFDWKGIHVHCQNIIIKFVTACPEAHEAVRSVLTFPFGSNTCSLDLICRNNEFQRCYLLNRFLVLLFAAHIEHQHRKVVIHYNSSITGLTKLDIESTNTTSWTQYDYRYQLRWTKDGVEEPDPLVCTVLIVRHKPRAFFPGEPPRPSAPPSLLEK